MLLPLTEGFKKASARMNTSSSINVTKSICYENNEHKEDSDEEEKEEEEETSKSTTMPIVTNTSTMKETEKDNSFFHTADSASDHLHRVITGE